MKEWDQGGQGSNLLSFGKCLVKNSGDGVWGEEKGKTDPDITGRVEILPGIGV